MGCNLSSKLAAAILVIFNIIFLLCGAAVLAFGILALVSPDTVIEILDFIPGFQNIEYIVDIQSLVLDSAIMLIVIGSIIFVVSFFGCCGAMKANSCLLFLYWFTVLLLMLFQLAVIMYAAIDTSQIRSRLADLMYTQLEEYFDPVSIDSDGRIHYSEDDGARAWETLQFQYSCCGATDYKDFQIFDWNSTIDVGSEKIVDAVVPPSCCIQYNQYIAPNYTNFINLTTCLTAFYNETTSRNTLGCNVAVSNRWSEYSWIMTVIIAGLIAVEVLAIMLSLGMQGNIKEQKAKKKAKKPKKAAQAYPPPDYE